MISCWQSHIHSSDFAFRKRIVFLSVYIWDYRFFQETSSHSSLSLQLYSIQTFVRPKNSTSQQAARRVQASRQTATGPPRLTKSAPKLAGHSRKSSKPDRPCWSGLSSRPLTRQQRRSSMSSVFVFALHSFFCSWTLEGALHNDVLVPLLFLPKAFFCLWCNKWICNMYFLTSDFMPPNCKFYKNKWKLPIFVLHAVK